MTGADKVWVRCTLSVFVVTVSVVFVPVLLLFKLCEGVLLAAKITKDCLAQVWTTQEPR